MACGQVVLRPTSQSHFVRQGRVAAPSVCCAVACILLAAAPTAPPCFRRWRRSSPLPLVGEPLAKRRSFAKCQGLPSLGEVARRRRDGEVESSKSYPVRSSFVQPLSLTLFARGSPGRGASGEKAKLCGMPRPPLVRGGGTASAVTERLSPAEAFRVSLHLAITYYYITVISPNCKRRGSLIKK